MIMCGCCVSKCYDDGGRVVGTKVSTAFIPVELHCSLARLEPCLGSPSRVLFASSTAVKRLEYWSTFYSNVIPVMVNGNNVGNG